MGTGSCLAVEEGTVMEWELIVPPRELRRKQSTSKTVVSLSLLEEQVWGKKTEEGWRRAVLIYLRIRLVRGCST